jgi:hypothetical protein
LDFPGRTEAQEVAAVSIEEALKRAPDTRLFDAGAGVLDAVADVYHDCLGVGEAVVVADETTFDVARGLWSIACGRQGCLSRRR